MNIVKRPGVYDFTGSMNDLVLDSSNSVTVDIKFNGKVIQSEEYAPDANYIIRVRGLGRLCGLCVWGQSLDYRGEQHTHGGMFTFVVDGTAFNSWLYYSERWRKEKPVEAGVLTDCKRRVTYPGAVEVVSGFPFEQTSTNSSGEEVTKYLYHVYAVRADGVMMSKNVYVTVDGTMPYAYTIETSVEQVEALMGLTGIKRYLVEFQGGRAEYIVDRGAVAELRHLRFRNMYDLPEVVHFTGGLSLEAANESETSEVDGVKRKFGVKVKDEYKVYSGGIRLGEEYRLWRDLCNSKEVELLVDGYGWVPVVITKHKLVVDVFKHEFKQAELTLNLADERLSGIDNV